MKTVLQNLLSRKVFGRVALNQILSKISLKFPKRVQWLIIVSFILISLLGYYPTYNIPPLRQAIVKAQNQEQKEEIITSSFSKPLILPHPGYLSTRFSPYHPGIDIAAGLGMFIHPIIDGEVSEVGRDLFGLGNFVEVSHENGFKSKYAHMGKIYVKAGGKVRSWNILGEVGLTGNTSGPHTHLEVTLNEKYIDPQTILPEIPNMPAPPRPATLEARGEPKVASLQAPVTK